MIYNKIEDVDRVMIEITNNCQALCPGCQRTAGGTKENPVNPTLTTGNDYWPVGGNMSPEIFKKALPFEFFNNQLDRTINISFNGNFGEPTFHPEFKDFITYIIDNQIKNKNKRVSIHMSTNGGLHDPDWWRDLAKILQRNYDYNRPNHLNEDYISFAIDGIDDKTQQKYRRNVNYDKAMANARAFIESGGKAVWQFIVFKHNEHQVEEAKKLCKEYGFMRMETSRTRSVFNAIEDSIDGKRVIEAEETKKHAKESLIQNDEHGKEKEIYKKTIDAVFKDKTKTVKENIKNYHNETKIECSWGNQRRIMVEHDGTVWQCCYFVGSELYGYDLGPQLDYYLKKYPEGWNSLHYNSLENIICESQFWKNDLQDSWNNKMESKINPRMDICSRHCGSLKKNLENIYQNRYL